MNALGDDTLLPPLRQELRLEAAAKNRDGIPRWRLYDPLQHRFYLIGEEDVELLSLWSCGSVGALRRALAQRMQSLDEELFAGLLRFLGDHHLLQARGKHAVQRLDEQRKRLRGRGLSGQINRYLAFRLPLWRPDGLLDFVLPLVRAVGQRSVIVLWAVLTLIGLYLTTRQWDQFIGTFSDFFSPSGMLAYGCALAGLKVLHELGHAYMAQVRGCRVGSMGISIFMGMPMLYTDLGDVARLDDPRQRMWIASGGVLAETFVAGLATLAWAIFPEGTLRSVAFVIATSSWLTSLVINLNPLSRFDGYYVLGDALQVDNLQPRALAYTRWLLGRMLLGPVEDAPEPLSRERAAFFASYGTLVFLYQIALSCGIAWFAYQQLFASAGVLLLTYALYQFVGRRLLRTLQHWWGLRQAVTLTRRVVLLALGGAVLLLFFAPLDRHVSVPAVLGWQDATPIQAPENSRIEEVLVQRDAQVKAGQVLIRFSSPELQAKQAKAQLDLVIASERLDRIGGDVADRAEATVLQQQQLQARADLAGLAERARLLEWRAPEDGRLVDMPTNLQAGQWVRPDTTLGRLLHGDGQDASGFVAEKDLGRLRSGASGMFFADDPSLPRHPVRLLTVEDSASEFITPDSLSSRFGGPIASRANEHDRSVPVVAQHRVNFVLTDGGSRGLPLRIRGMVRLDAEPQSLAEQSFRRLWRLLNAELRE